MNSKDRNRLLVTLRLGEASGDELYDPWMLCEQAADVIEKLICDLGSERSSSLGIARAGCAKCVDMPDEHVPALRCVRCGAGYWFEGGNID